MSGHPLTINRDVIQEVRNADADVVRAQRHADLDLDGDVLMATNIFTLVEDFFGGRRLAADWLAGRPEPLAADPQMTEQVVELICGDRLWSILDAHTGLALAWRRRTDALVACRDRMLDHDVVLTTLLRDTGWSARQPVRLAKLAALTWLRSRPVS